MLVLFSEIIRVVINWFVIIIKVFCDNVVSEKIIIIGITMMFLSVKNLNTFLLIPALVYSKLGLFNSSYCHSKVTV